MTTKQMTGPGGEPGSVLGCAPVLSEWVRYTWIGGDFIYWVRGRPPMALDRFVGAVVPHLDGRTNLRELSADLAWSIGENARHVEEHLANAFLKLARVEAVDGIPAELWEETDRPGPVQVEELPGGGVIKSVTLEFSTRTGAELELVENVLAGKSTKLDLVPADSCAGQRLRMGQPASRFCVDLGGRTLAVRCDHAATSKALAASCRPAADDHEGLTIAVVTSPFNGSGSPRVYDSSGARVGRPRSGEEAAEVVAHLFNESLPAPALGPVAVAATAATSRDSCVLLPDGLVSAPRLTRQLAKGGARAVPTRRVLLDTDGVRIEGAFGAPPKRYDLAAILVPDLADGLAPATRAALQLISVGAADDLRAMRSTLERLRDIVSSDPLRLAPLPPEIDDMGVAVLSALKRAARDQTAGQ